MTGRIESTFQRLGQANKKALIAYLMAGDPTLADTER
ncbi:MAG: tryptophan synthase subunit alpha, partial [Nitrospirota bacterium]